MKKQFQDSSGLDLGGNNGVSFQDLFPDHTSQADTFNFLPTADVPAQVSLQVHATTTTTGSTTQLVSSTSTISHVDYHWDGITFGQSGGYYPPDNALAAGANVVITAENDAIQITTLQGTSPQTESLNTFFSSVLPSGYFLTDPRVLYDAANHQFVVAVDEVSNNLTSSNIVLAVSQQDPASLASTYWHFGSASTTLPLNGTTTWADQPLVSIDGTDIYVSTNQFSTSGAYEGTALSVFGYGLNKVGSTTFASSPYSYQPAAIAGGGEYLVSDTHNSLSIFKSSIDPATNTVANTTPSTVSLVTASGNIDYGNGSYSASQYGTSYKLDAGDGRITSAAYDSNNHKLYVVFEGQPSSSNATPSVEWAQLEMSGATPVVLNTGNLNSLLLKTGVTAGAATFNGSVAVDGAGDVLFNFNVSGSHMYAADYFTFWKGAGSATATTQPNFASPIDYHDSVAAYIDPAHDLVSRWGDYSTATADPANANGFYISNEFDNGKLLHYSSWGTSVDHVNLLLA